ncbi:MAG: hypothetical protein ACP5I3_10630 [Thermoproteus sp.]
MVPRVVISSFRGMSGKTLIFPRLDLRASEGASRWLRSRLASTTSDPSYHEAAALAARSALKRVLLPLVEGIKSMASDGRLEEALRLSEALRAVWEGKRRDLLQTPH